jgi:hypothetical protein
MPQSIRVVLCFRGPAMAQTALERTRPAKIVMAGRARSKQTADVSERMGRLIKQLSLAINAAIRRSASARL